MLDFITKTCTFSLCIDAYFLGHQLITPLDLVQILTFLRLIISGKQAIFSITVFASESTTTIHLTWRVISFRFLGTSGQNVDDLEKYSEAKDKLEFMERTLRWRHLAPTAPNTLGVHYMYFDALMLLHFYLLGYQSKSYFTCLIKFSGMLNIWESYFTCYFWRNPRVKTLTFSLCFPK